LRKNIVNVHKAPCHEVSYAEAECNSYYDHKYAKKNCKRGMDISISASLVTIRNCLNQFGHSVSFLVFGIFLSLLYIYYTPEHRESQVK